MYGEDHKKLVSFTNRPKLDECFTGELSFIDVLNEQIAREKAIEIAKKAKGGLEIDIYEDHTDYFVDFTLKEGEVKELRLGGGNDERDGWIL